jgi:hypothetical protein
MTMDALSSGLYIFMFESVTGPTRVFFFFFFFSNSSSRSTGEDPQH